MRLAFNDTAATVEVPDNPKFLAALRATAAGWPFTVTTGASEPVVTVSERDGGFFLSVSGGSPVRRTAVSTACGVIVEVVNAYVAERAENLCFHCGAALFGDRLIMFPSQFRAGKSTLIASLAAAGHTIFSDDMLPVSADDLGGVALGIAPRLRIPLPGNSSQSFRKFVADHTAVADRRYAYLGLPEGRLAPRNTVASLGAMVLLDRNPTGPALLRRATRSFALQSLILQNFARMTPSHELLQRLHRLMDRLPRFVLSYSDLEEATVLLETTFGRWPLQNSGGAFPLVRASNEMARSAPPQDVDANLGSLFAVAQPLLRNADVDLQVVDAELFLADADGRSIYCLNPIGAGLWNLLAQPTSREEAVEVLLGAFPDIDRGTVAADVTRVFAGLSAAGLISAAKPSFRQKKAREVALRGRLDR